MGVMPSKTIAARLSISLASTSNSAASRRSHAIEAHATSKKMGYIMKDLGSKIQTFSITHLPQIAAMGTSHIKVYKTADDQTTRTYIKRLEGEDRAVEIAQMIDGNQITQTARTYAEKLLN